MATERIQDSSTGEGSRSRRDRYTRGVRSFRKTGAETENHMSTASATKDQMIKEFDEIDWINFKSTSKHYMPDVKYVAGARISDEERKLRMLRSVSHTCMVCSMCELGLHLADENNCLRDPHVFSNMKVSRFMVVGQNPKWDELRTGEPFTGTSGRIFDQEITKHGLYRDDFYICNVVRCRTKEDSNMTQQNIEQCRPFLQMEINLLKPKIIITLGSVAFSQLCPEAIFEESFKKLIPSKYGVKVFPICHPSQHDIVFEDQIRVMCGLVKAKLHRLRRFPD